MALTISISARKIALILGGISVYLCIQSLFVKVIEYTVPPQSYSLFLYEVGKLVSVSHEESLPTWYSSLILFAAAVLVAVVARVKKKNRDRYVTHWIFLAIIFTYLSLDEATYIHERLSDPLREAFHTEAVLPFAWAIAGALFTLIIGLAYLRFLLHLPPRTRNLIILAGGLYVGGALVVDAISARWYTVDEGISLTYWLIATIEELMEMLGVVVLIYALYSYLGTYVREIHFLNTGEKPPVIAPDDSHP